MKLYYKGELVKETPVNGAKTGLRFDTISLDFRDITDLRRMGDVRQWLDHWACGFPATLIKSA